MKKKKIEKFSSLNQHNFKVKMVSTNFIHFFRLPDFCPRLQRSCWISVICGLNGNSDINQMWNDFNALIFDMIWCLFMMTMTIYIYTESFSFANLNGNTSPNPCQTYMYGIFRYALKLPSLKNREKEAKNFVVW